MVIDKSGRAYSLAPNVIKSCPFCGSKWTLVKYSNNPFDKKHVYGGFEAYCDDCCNRTKRFNTPEEAIEAWNRRAGE